MATQTINLHEKFAQKTVDIFRKASVVGGLLSDEFDWTGAKTVKVSTLLTTPMHDYRRSGDNRFGDPTEVGDIMQELTVTQDRSFSSTVDRGNYVDQDAMKTGAKVVALQLKERAVPEADKYILKRLAELGGSKVGKTEALTKTNVIDRITDGTVALDDAEAPDGSRALMVTSKVYKLIRLSDEFIGVDKLADKSLSKGQIGELDGMKVIKVPEGRWPAGVNFMIVCKESAIAPFKIDETYMHKNPPGLSGIRVEGRKYYDCFVFASKANGVYVDIDTAVKDIVALPVVTMAGDTATVTAVSGVVFKYTLDGSDPRYMKADKVTTYTAPVKLAAGQVMKVYGEAAGKYPSNVTEAAV